jgi:hypothetical protein
MTEYKPLAPHAGAILNIVGQQPWLPWAKEWSIMIWNSCGCQLKIEGKDLDSSRPPAATMVCCHVLWRETGCSLAGGRDKEVKETEATGPSNDVQLLQSDPAGIHGFCVWRPSSLSWLNRFGEKCMRKRFVTVFEFNPTKLGNGRATAEAVSRWLPTAAARVQSRVWSSGICGGQSGTGAGFLRLLRFPLPFIPPNSPSSQSPGAGSIGQ